MFYSRKHFKIKLIFKSVNGKKNKGFQMRKGGVNILS